MVRSIKLFAALLLLPLLTIAAQNPLAPKQAAKQTAGQEPQTSTDPLGRETPHGAVLGFIRAAQDENYGVATQYFQPPSGRHRRSPEEEQDLAVQLLAV